MACECKRGLPCLLLVHISATGTACGPATVQDNSLLAAVGGGLKHCFLSPRLMNDSAGCRAIDKHKLHWECLADVQEAHASVMRTPWNRISSIKTQEHMDSLRTRLQQLPVSGEAVGVLSLEICECQSVRAAA